MTIAHDFRLAGDLDLNGTAKTFPVMCCHRRYLPHAGQCYAQPAAAASVHSHQARQALFPEEVMTRKKGRAIRALLRSHDSVVFRPHRLHHHLAHVLAGCRADPAALHGRGRGAPLPRVRHHARGGDPRVLAAGTPREQNAMAFHEAPGHATRIADHWSTAGTFETNGLPRQKGAPYADPNGEIQTLSQTLPVWPAGLVLGVLALSQARRDGDPVACSTSASSICWRSHGMPTVSRSSNWRCPRRRLLPACRPRFSNEMIHLLACIVRRTEHVSPHDQARSTMMTTTMPRMSSWKIESTLK